MDKISFFSADYRDGRVHIDGKSYPAGTFAAHLLTQYYINNTAARIIVFTSDNWLLERSLERGYLYVLCDLAACDYQHQLVNDELRHYRVLHFIRELRNKPHEIHKEHRRSFFPCGLEHKFQRFAGHALLFLLRHLPPPRQRNTAPASGTSPHTRRFSP